MNTLEHNARAELEKIYSEVEKDVTDTLQRISSTEQIIKEIVDHYNSMKTCASNLQCFIGIQEVEKIIEQE